MNFCDVNGKPETPFCVAGFCVEPGAKLHANAEVPLNLHDASTGLYTTLKVRIPMVLINGARSGPRLTIFSGVHGGEFVGILANSELAHRLVDPAQLRGRLALCLVANPPAAMEGRVSKSHLDGLNINRVFPGNRTGTPTEQLAAWLFEHLLPGSDAFIDLHSGGIDEYLHDFVGYRRAGKQEIVAKARALAHSLGMQYVIYGDYINDGNSHAAAMRMNIPAILVECGEHGSRDQSVGLCEAHRLLRAMAHLDMIDADQIGDPWPVNCPIASPTEFVWAGFVQQSRDTGFWYPEFRVNDKVKFGQRIGRIVDPATGAILSEVKANASGSIIYAMNGLTVSPGTDLVAIAAPAPKTNESVQDYKVNIF